MLKNMLHVKETDTYQWRLFQNEYLNNPELQVSPDGVNWYTVLWPNENGKIVLNKLHEKFSSDLPLLMTDSSGKYVYTVLDKPDK